MDFTEFREAFQILMTDKMTVKRLSDVTTDEWGNEVPAKWETVYTDIKCRVSQLNQNFNNPNSQDTTNLPVTYKLKIFAPQDIVIKAGDKITLTTTERGQEIVYEDKRASAPIPYTNHIEFYIGIDKEA